MAFNFPSTPTIGQSYQGYVWDGEKWGTGALGYGAIYMSDVPPPAAPAGSLWYETDTGFLFAKVDDGNSVQWVQVVSGPPDAVLFNTKQTLNDTQQTLARANINAGSMADIAQNNIIINSGMQINQESPRAVQGYNTNAFYYLADQWYFAAAFTGPYVYTAQEAYGNTNLSATMNSPLTVAAGTYFQFYQPIETFRIMRLAWGSVNAVPLAVGFFISSAVDTTVSLAVKNATSDRSYCLPIFLKGGVATYVTAVIPGCLDGTWGNVTGPGNSGQGSMAMSIGVCWVCGSTYTAPVANAWVNGNYLAAPTATNGYATANSIRMWNFTAIPGTTPVPQSMSAFAMRTFDQELMLCQRYYEKTYPYGDIPGTVYSNARGGGPIMWIGYLGGNYPLVGYYYKVRKRVAPTLKVYSPYDGAVGTVHAPGVGNAAQGYADYNDETGVCLVGYFTPGIAGGQSIYCHLVADARF